VQLIGEGEKRAIVLVTVLGEDVDHPPIEASFPSQFDPPRY
jgi:hypothetical protein